MPVLMLMFLASVRNAIMWNALKKFYFCKKQLRKSRYRNWCKTWQEKQVSKWSPEFDTEKEKSPVLMLRKKVYCCNLTDKMVAAAVLWVESTKRRRGTSDRILYTWDTRKR